ncbi:MAG: energy-coupling factor ABC transporter permease [Fimbriimonadaceae bacterium]|nr:energy-coupling factor ABC transporter permease [Fimbriimonadaceae bacterium]
MHLPDGFLSAPVSTVLAAASFGGLGAAVRRSRPAVDAPVVTPLLGVAAAFVFCAQMFNFPISGGTTGHLLGAALVTALLGPWRAMLVMASVLLVQALIFADGGVVALGANLFNMAVAAPLLAGLVQGLVQRAGRQARWTREVGLAVSAWLTVQLAAACCAVEIAFSGTAPLAVVLPAMLAVHAVIGLGEALLSVAAYRVVVGARPELAGHERPVAELATMELWRLAAMLALGLLVVALAFPYPDGLEWVAEQQQFGHHARDGFAAAPLRDYAVPGRPVGSGFDWFGSYLSAILGAALCGGLMRWLGRAGRQAPDDAS